MTGLVLVSADTLPGGKHWSLLLRRNARLRLTDLEGGANVGMVFYNPANLLERYNTPDTLKCQHSFKLTAGHCLYSDMGRIFCSVVDDTPSTNGDRSRPTSWKLMWPGLAKFDSQTSFSAADFVIAPAASTTLRCGSPRLSSTWQPMQLWIQLP